jgi:hypothetical protein
MGSGASARCRRRSRIVGAVIGRPMTAHAITATHLTLRTSVSLHTVDLAQVRSATWTRSLSASLTWTSH